MITWRGGYWEGGKVRVSKGCRVVGLAAAVWYLRLGGKSHSPPTDQHVSAQGTKHIAGAQTCISGPIVGPNSGLGMIEEERPCRLV